MSLNLIFAGTPEFAAEHLQALIDSEHRVVAVYSQPAPEDPAQDNGILDAGNPLLREGDDVFCLPSYPLFFFPPTVG